MGEHETDGLRRKLTNKLGTPNGDQGDINMTGTGHNINGATTGNLNISALTQGLNMMEN